MYDEHEHRIRPAWARTAPRLNSLGGAVASGPSLWPVICTKGHIRQACDAAVRVLVYGQRQQERRGQVAPIGRVRRPTGGPGIMARGSIGVDPRDARKKRAEEP